MDEVSFLYLLACIPVLMALAIILWIDFFHGGEMGKIDETTHSDHFEEPIDPAPRRLYDLAERAIEQGRADKACDALEPIVNPPRGPEPGRGLQRGM